VHEKKHELLAYGSVEDKCIHGVRAQWASEAKAGSVYGDEDGKPLRPGPPVHRRASTPRPSRGALPPIQRAG
jgi:hypothetical protein